MKVDDLFSRTEDVLGQAQKRVEKLGVALADELVAGVHLLGRSGRQGVVEGGNEEGIAPQGIFTLLGL